jgi:putative transposase
MADQRPANGVGLSLSRLVNPWRGGYVEWFNSQVRDGCLNINSFW